MQSQPRINQSESLPKKPESLEIRILTVLVGVFMTVSTYFVTGYLAGIKEEFSSVNNELTLMNKKIGDLLEVYVRLDEKNSALENRVVRNEKDIDRILTVYTGHIERIKNEQR